MGFIVDPVHFKGYGSLFGKVVQPFAMSSRHLGEAFEKTNSVAQRVGYLALGVIELIPILNYFIVYASYLYSTKSFRVDENYIARHVSITASEIVFKGVYSPKWNRIADTTVNKSGHYHTESEDLGYFSPGRGSCWGPIGEEVNLLYLENFKDYLDKNKEIKMWFDQMFKAQKGGPRHEEAKGSSRVQHTPVDKACTIFGYASLNEIRDVVALNKRKRELSLARHPDKNGGDQGPQKELNCAYDALKSRIERRQIPKV